MKEILMYSIIGIVCLVLVYLLSRIQMKGWLHEIDNEVGKKFTDTINNNKLKREKDEKTEKI